MTRSMLHHLGKSVRIAAVVAASLSLASFTVEVHPAAPASEWLRWFCVFGAAIAVAVMLACLFSKGADDHRHPVTHR